MDNENTADEEQQGTEWAVYECAAMMLWQCDLDADDADDDEAWDDLGDSIRSKYRQTARAVIQTYLETMDGN